MKMPLLIWLQIFLLPAFGQKNNSFHFNSLVVDTHNDVLGAATMKGLRLEDDLTGKTHSDIGRFIKGGVDVQIFSIFCDGEQANPFQFALREIDSLDAITKRNPGKMQLVNSATALKKVVRQNKLAVMKGVEGGHMIEDKLDNLDSLFKRGARYMTLTWNNSTNWASSAKDETEMGVKMPSEGSKFSGKKGLSDFGKGVVKRMNELGMLVDLSHVGEQTFWDAINIVSKPVIVSHSCVYALCGHRRNLKDEQIKAVAKNGGVICINFFAGFLDSNYNKAKDAFLTKHSAEKDSLTKMKWPDYEISSWLTKKYPVEAENLRPALSLLIDHIDYIVRLIGVDYVGLGSDFDGIDSAPKELDSVADMPKVTTALLQRGYSKKEVRKILGENFLRVLSANE